MVDNLINVIYFRLLVKMLKFDFTPILKHQLKDSTNRIIDSEQESCGYPAAESVNQKFESDKWD